MLLPNSDYRFVLLRVNKTNIYDWSDYSIHFLIEDATAARKDWEKRNPLHPAYHDVIFTMNGFMDSTTTEDYDIIGYNLLRMSGKIK